MKTCLILPLVVFASISAFGQGDPFEAAVGTLVNSTVEAVKSSGNKKLAVLDVRDLQDLSSPFGRYLAEQLSVGLVMAKGDFTVVDRMNLKSILAEHKLSEVSRGIAAIPALLGHAGISEHGHDGTR